MRIILTDIFLPHRLFLLPCWRRPSPFADHRFWQVPQALGHLPLPPQYIPQRQEIFALWTHGTLCIWLFYGTCRCFTYNTTHALLENKTCILQNHMQQVTSWVGAQIWSRLERLVTSKESTSQNNHWSLRKLCDGPCKGMSGSCFRIWKHYIKIEAFWRWDLTNGNGISEPLGSGGNTICLVWKMPVNGILTSGEGSPVYRYLSKVFLK